MRSRPTPSAPSSTAFAASAAEPRFANTSIRVPSRGGAGLVRAFERRRAPALGPVAALGCVALDVRGRVDQKRAGLAVDQHGRALDYTEHRVAEPDHRRQPERAGEDRGVGGRGAVRGGDPSHERRIERGGIGGCELAGDDDPGSRSAGLGRPRERVDDPAADVEHVGRALLQQWLVERAVPLGDARGRVVPGALGGGPGADRVLRRLEHRLVVEQREVGVEDRGVGLARPGRHGLAIALDRRSRGGDRLARVARVRGRADRAPARAAVRSRRADGEPVRPRARPRRGRRSARLPAPAARSSVAPAPVAAGACATEAPAAEVRRRDPVAEPLVGELRERQQHVVGLRARSAHQRACRRTGLRARRRS